MNDTALKWFKSSYSGSDGGQCIEIAAAPAAVHVRDSKDPDGGTLTFTPEAWSAFTDFVVADAGR
jgi:hypothetical protein